ncbi:hypothetical protein [Ferrimonas pelagia]|uniref:Uncharacterized protein n=1 Tax=Ferrimonas pelagia TaxID=1177826 RepID=A0ABP9FI67_9GAMM
MADEPTPQLNDVLGALVSGVAHARRVADSEVMRIARFYRNHEHLNGLTVPRLRIDRIAIDLPILVDRVVPAVNAKWHAPSDIAAQSRQHLTESVQAMKQLLAQGHHELEPDIAGLALKLIELITPTWLDDFEKLQASRLQLLINLMKRTAAAEAASDVMIQDEVGHSTEELLRSLLKELLVTLVDKNHDSKSNGSGHSALIENTMVSDAITKLIQDIRSRTEQNCLLTATTPAGLDVRVDTEAIKNAGSPNSMTRLRMVLTEEGLEWSTEENDDGDVKWKLLPE